MENIVLETFAGNSFSNVAEKAKKMATDTQNVEFGFNGIKCLVSKTTNLEFLSRDYSNAFLMDWKEIGYDCLAEYPLNVKIELQKRTEEREERQRLQRIEWEKEESLKQDLLNSKIGEIEFNCKNPEALQSFEDANKDGYGFGIMTYAKLWGRLMQYEIDKGAKLIDIATSTSHDADIEGITGFMYGAAVKVLSECWFYGEDLRKWHNKEYGHLGEGVVNPAVLSVSV